MVKTQLQGFKINILKYLSTKLLSDSYLDTYLVYFLSTGKNKRFHVAIEILMLTYTETAPGMQPLVKLDRNLQVAMRVSRGTSKWNSCPSRYDLNSKIFRPITVSDRMYFCGTVGGEPAK